MSTANTPNLAKNFKSRAFVATRKSKELRRTGRAEDGIALLEPLRREGEGIINPSFSVVEKRVVVLCALAACHQALRQDREAETCLKDAVTLNPRDAVAWTSLGNLYAKRSRDDEAIECYETVLKGRNGTPLIDPRNVVAWTSLGNLYAKRGRDDEAIECYETVLKGRNGTPPIDPRDAVAWNSLGHLYAKRSRDEEAIACYETVLKGRNGTPPIDPRNPVTWTELGITHFKRGQYEEALACFEHVQALEPKDQPYRPFRYLAARIHHAYGRLPVACTLLTPLLGQQDEKALILYMACAGENELPVLKAIKAAMDATQKGLFESCQTEAADMMPDPERLWRELLEMQQDSQSSDRVYQTLWHTPYEPKPVHSAPPLAGQFYNPPRRG